jgi:hypothetical protein
MSLTNYTELKILDHVYGGTTWSPLATIYFGLATAVSNIETGAHTEATGTAYARVAKTNNTTNFPSANPKLSGTDIDFGTVGAGGWGTLTHLVVYDASSGGNVLEIIPLAVSRTPIAGDPVKIVAGSFSLALD